MMAGLTRRGILYGEQMGTALNRETLAHSLISNDDDVHVKLPCYAACRKKYSSTCSRGGMDIQICTTRLL